MDISAAIVEVGSTSRKPMRVIATSRRDVISALLTLPELQGNKQQAMKIAQVVWDMQGKVDAKQPAVRAHFVEEMPQPKQPAQPKKAGAPAVKSVAETTPENIAEPAEHSRPMPLLSVT